MVSLLCERFFQDLQECNITSLQHHQCATSQICNITSVQYHQCATSPVCNTASLQHAQRPCCLQALGIFGTNFQAVADRLATRMAQQGLLAVKRSRKQVKLKFNKEEKLHPRRIDMTLRGQVCFRCLLNIDGEQASMCCRPSTQATLCLHSAYLQ